MNYKESKLILKETKKAKRILLNCHRSPDSDAIGSALALYQILKVMKKDVEIVCPSELDARLKFLKDFDIIQIIDFSNFDLTKFDLFVCLDSSSWDMVVNDRELLIPPIPVVVIDHHATNTKYGTINLVDTGVSSVGELVYKVFEDWKVEIDSDTASALLAAIIGDTGTFKYVNTTSKTLKIASELTRLGADKDKIIYSLFRTNEISLFKFVGEVLQNLEIDKDNKFVWAAVSYELYKKWSKPPDGKDLAISLYAQSTADTDFGLFLLEIEKGKYSISFRARNEKIDVSKLAVKLGGGGHKVAAGGGGSLEGKSFDEALKITLTEARKFARENKRSRPKRS